MNRAQARKARRAFDRGEDLQADSIEAVWELIAALGMGRATDLLILHDDVCTPHVCQCSPTYVLRQLTEKNYAQSQKLEADWKRNSTN